MEGIKDNNTQSLRYLQQQTPELCMTFVQRDGMELQYVINQTEEICLAAVRQNGMALQFVRQQTERICIAAYKQCSDSLMYSVFSVELLDAYARRAQAMLMGQQNVTPQPTGQNLKHTQQVESVHTNMPFTESIKDKKQRFMNYIRNQSQTDLWKTAEKMNTDQLRCLLEYMVVHRPDVFECIALMPNEFRELVTNKIGADFTVTRYYESVQ